MRPPASSPEVRRRMQAVRRRDTALEMRLRSALHRMGLRYRVDRSPLPGQKRRADLVFPTERVAVYVDGCFWHGCPIHATWPKANADWWREKLQANRARDASTDAQLRAQGWTVVRVWGHESVPDAAERVAGEVRRARTRRGDEGRHDLAGGGFGAIESLLTGGNPRSLRNADIVISAASGRPERLEELVRCVFSADEIVRMRASDALEKVCRADPGLLRRFVPLLLGEMSRIEQPSVQWHLAQMLAEVRLDERERAEAVAILEHNLDTSGDWIVTNLTLQALATFARTSPVVRTRLIERLRHYRDSPYKSVAARARKLLAEFDGEPSRAVPP